MGFYRKFFNFDTEKTVFFCIIDNKKLLSIVKMRYATEISYNDTKTKILSRPFTFFLLLCGLSLKGPFSLKSKGFLREIFRYIYIYIYFFLFYYSYASAWRLSEKKWPWQYMAATCTHTHPFILFYFNLEVVVRLQWE